MTTKTKTPRHIRLDDIALSNPPSERSERDATLHAVATLHYFEPRHRGSQGHYSVIFECVERYTVRYHGERPVEMETRRIAMGGSDRYRSTVLEYVPRFNARRLDELAAALKIPNGHYALTFDYAARLAEYLAVNRFERKDSKP